MSSRGRSTGAPVGELESGELGHDGLDAGIGFVRLYPSFSSLATARILILDDLFVAELARRCDVVLALMKEARRHARSAGACRIQVTTGKTNDGARRLYRKLGYEPDVEFEAWALKLR